MLFSLLCCLFSLQAALPENGSFTQWNGDKPADWSLLKRNDRPNTFKKIDVKLKIAGMNPPQHLVKMVEEVHNVELIDSPDDQTLFDLIRHAHINILVTEQATGLKLKLLNTLFNGRFCLVNDKMVDGLDVNGLCYVVNDQNAIRFAVDELMPRRFDEHQIERRRKNMKKFYNIEEATDLLLNLIG